MSQAQAEQTQSDESQTISQSHSEEEEWQEEESQTISQSQSQEEQSQTISQSQSQEEQIQAEQIQAEQIQAEQIQAEQIQAEQIQEYNRQMEEIGRTFIADQLEAMRIEQEQEWQEELRYRESLLKYDICQKCQGEKFSIDNNGVKKWCLSCGGIGRDIPKVKSSIIKND